MQEKLGYPGKFIQDRVLKCGNIYLGSSALRLESVIRVWCVICFHVYFAQEGYQ